MVVEPQCGLLESRSVRSSAELGQVPAEGGSPGFAQNLLAVFG